MRRTLLGLAILAFAGTVFAQRVTEINGRHVQLFPDKDHAAQIHAARTNSNLVYHNGPVIHLPKIVAIFWGSEWSSGAGATRASHVTGFFQGFGTTGEYKIIGQYYDSSGSIVTGTNFITASWNDTSNPPTNVSDSAVQGEVEKYVNAFQAGKPDPATIYEVFLPSTSYASYGSSDSCGGPNLQFCAYHSNFSYNGVDTKYSSMPYPSCSGCHSSGFTPEQDLDHFSCHETREAVTDEDGNAWYDRRGNEADDKCAWSPAPFLEGGYGYQWEWSNQNAACVQKF